MHVIDGSGSGLTATGDAMTCSEDFPQIITCEIGNTCCTCNPGSSQLKGKICDLFISGWKKAQPSGTGFVEDGVKVCKTS